MAAETTFDRDAFVTAWNDLPRAHRSRIRRVVRLGRRLDTFEEATIAVAYSRFQVARLWSRYFWIWFVPGVIVATGVAVKIHPLVVGVLLAMAAQAVMAHRNLRRVERVNAEILTEPRR